MLDKARTGLGTVGRVTLRWSMALESEAPLDALCRALVEGHDAVSAALVVRGDRFVAEAADELDLAARNACLRAALSTLSDDRESDCARLVVDDVMSSMAVRVDKRTALVVLFFDQPEVTHSLPRVLARAVLQLRRRGGAGAAPPAASGGSTPPAAHAFLGVEALKDDE